MAKYSGAKTVIIADIQADRVDFAVQNKFADAKIVVPMKRFEAIEDKLNFAKEVAELVKGASGIGEVDAIFECTGVESCLQAAIYVSFTVLDTFMNANVYTVNETRWTHHVDWDGKSYPDLTDLSCSSTGS